MSRRRGLRVRLFRLALSAYPREWRRRFGDEAVEAFREAMAAREGEVGAGAAGRYALRASLDALVSGWRQRMSARALRHASPHGSPDGWLGSVGTDLRLAARRLRRAPAFTLAAVTIVSLGVGVNAAVFTVLRDAVLAPLPFPEADRLVLPRWGIADEAGSDTVYNNWSYPHFSEFREETEQVFDAFAGYAARSATVTEPGEAESIPYELVSPGYMELLGMTPVVGRFFRPEEEGRDAPPGVAILSHALWVQRFGSDPGAVGGTITSDGVRLRVVGVAPEGFRGLTGEARFWIPFGQAREVFGSWAMEGRNSHWLHAVARLRPGVTPAAARERTAPLAAAIDAVQTSLDEGQRLALEVAPLTRIWTNPTARTSLWLAMGAALLVLAIAVANLASLLLARGRREVRETAVRLALGAGRGRLVRERLTESLVLSVGGGAVGLLLAGWSMQGLRAALPESLFRGAGGDLRLVETGALGLDPGVVLFGLGVAMSAGILFGVAPALVQSSVDLVPALRYGGGGGRTLGSGRGRRWLVGGQVALSVMLLVGAGLLLATLRSLHGEQRGFDAENLLVLRYSLGGRTGAYYGSQEASRSFHRDLRDRVRSLPRVRSAAVGTTPPLSGHYIRTSVRGVVGEEPIPEGGRPPIGIHMVEGDFFSTLGTGLVRGRTFSEAEFTTADHVTVINRRAAEILFPGEDPLGREIRVGFSVHDEEHPFRIVGVVEDVLYSAPTEGVMPEMYLPLGLWPPTSMALFVRTTGDPLEIGPTVRQIVASLDQDIPIWQMTTGRELRSQDVADTRLLLVLLGAFAGLALVLSGAGLWAVVAQAVAERRREIGLRMALGARGREVEGLVLRQGTLPIVGGGLLGVVLAALAAPQLTAVLFGVGPRSPAVYVGAASILIGTALLATWLPARRASRVDPMEALAAD